MAAFKYFITAKMSLKLREARFCGDFFYWINIYLREMLDKLWGTEHPASVLRKKQEVPTFVQ